MAYAQSKTANALAPGYILTNLQQHINDQAMVGMTRFRVPEPESVEQGAATSVLLAGSPLLDGITGKYFEDCNQAPVVHDSSGWIEGVAPWAIDPDNACRLWDLSESLLETAQIRPVGDVAPM